MLSYRPKTEHFDTVAVNKYKKDKATITIEQFFSVAGWSILSTVDRCIGKLAIASSI